MKKNIQKLSKSIIKKPAFTLIEVLITITILALIFTSVMSVFIYYSTLGAKVEANRLIQSNIKNIIEHISNDIKNNRINIYTQENPSPDSHKILSGDMYAIENNKLYVGDNTYYIGVPSLSGMWIIADPDYCEKIENNCRLIKVTPTEQIPLSNSWVSFRNMYFHVSDDYIPKVTINFNMGIAVGKGLKEGVIKSNNIQIQTTISEKLLDQNL